MLRKITDITKRSENTQGQGAPLGPEQFKETPVQVEVERKIEAMPTPEVKPEKIEEAPQVIIPTPTTTAPVGQVPAKNPVLEKIEDVLEEDLEEIYFQLPQDKQAEFRQVGEETASQIAMLLGAVKVKVKEILALIIKWLRIIPHVNKFYLEQEAKIKTDKLLDLKEKGEIPQSGNQNKI